MKKNISWSLYLIIVTIVISIAVQVFWNYKNYQEHKKLFIQNTQQSLDNAVDIYFSQIAKKEFSFSGLNKHLITDSINTVLHKPRTIKMISINKDPNNITIKNGLEHDNEIQKILFQSDSINEELDKLTSVLISIIEDEIKLKKLKPILEQELDRRKIKMTFTINHYVNNEIIKTTDSITVYKNPIKTTSKATFLKDFEKIELVFPNQILYILKSGLIGILLSLILSIAIIASLFYLLNIIKKQKQIAEIKNDFISNITHEFKTPITTISLATEAIVEYNKQNNKEKADEYLQITKSQLTKLNVMVEKVLETSTLDNNKLLLRKEPIDIIKLLKKSVQKQFVSKEKSISFSSNVDSQIINIDSFHFQNAINNLIDNAIKYGGNEIKVNVQSILNNLEITITDNGRINKQYKSKIFDKFYRIPKGNTHDVKGFGIGLYYSKNIIEKHNGTLKLLDTANTTFKITLLK